MARAASSDARRAGAAARNVIEDRVERHNLAARILLVEPLRRLGANPASLDQFFDYHGQRKDFAVFATAQAAGQVAHDVGQHVDPRQIHRPERRAFRPADRGTGDGVNLLDRVLGVRRAPDLEDLHHAVQADAIGDEVRRVLAGTTPLPRWWSVNSATARSTAGSVSGVRIDVDEPQIWGGKSECRVRRHGTKATGLDDRRDRDPRCIGADDRIRRAIAVHAFEERLLTSSRSTTARRSSRLPRFPESPPRTRRCGRARGVGREKGIGLERARARQPVASRVAGDVEQQHREHRRWRSARQSARPWCRRRELPPSGCECSPILVSLPWVRIPCAVTAAAPIPRRRARRWRLLQTRACTCDG